MIMPPAWIDCLREAGAGDMTLQLRFLGDGERVLKPMYGRLKGAWHPVPVVVALAHAGMIEGRDEACHALTVTAKGRAWLDAHPPPAAV